MIWPPVRLADGAALPAYQSVYPTATAMRAMAEELRAGGGGGAL